MTDLSQAPLSVTAIQSTMWCLWMMGYVFPLRGCVRAMLSRCIPVAACGGLQHPNVLLVQVIDAHLAGNSAHSQRVYIRVSCGDTEFQTAVVKNRPHSVWNEAFSLVCDDTDNDITFDLCTKGGFGTSDKRVSGASRDVITLAPKTIQKRSFTLAGAGPELTSCVLQVLIARVHTASPTSGRVPDFMRACVDAGVSLAADGSGTGAGAGGASDGSDGSDVDPLEQFATLSQALRPGDYRIQVHIIKVAELRVGLSKDQVNPVVRVDLLGQTRNTRIQKGCLSAGIVTLSALLRARVCVPLSDSSPQSPCAGCCAVFDDYFTFDFKGLTLDELESAVVKVTVRDARRLRFDGEVGSASFGLPVVYGLPDHELYRRCAPITNSTSSSGMR